MVSSPFKKGVPDVIRPSGWEGELTRGLLRTESPARDKLFGSKAGLCERQGAAGMLYDSEWSKPMTPAAPLYFAVGNAFENAVHDALRKEGRLLTTELYVKGEEVFPWLKFGGRVDLILRGFNGEVVLGELKSCGKLPEAPKWPHQAQLYTYLLLTGMTDGVIWYVSRSVADWKGVVQQKAFEVSPSEKQLLHVARRLTRALVFADAGLLPRIPPHMKRYRCGFCQMVPYCWEDNEDAVKFAEGLPREPEPGEYEKLQERADKLANAIMHKRPELKESFCEYLESFVTIGEEEVSCE